MTTELLDLRDYPLPFFDESVSPMRMNGQYSNQAVAKWADKVKQADAYIMICPEYNHGYTAVLKNAIDHLYPEWNHKPVGFLSFGSTGGARAIEQLRLVAVELQLLPIKNAIHIPVDLYINTMNLTAAESPEVYNQALRKEGRDMVGTFLEELVNLAKATISLRVSG